MYPLIFYYYVLPIYIYLIRLLYYNTMYWFELLKLNKERKLCLDARANFFFQIHREPKTKPQKPLYIYTTYCTGVRTHLFWQNRTFRKRNQNPIVCPINVLSRCEYYWHLKTNRNCPLGFFFMSNDNDVTHNPSEMHRLPKRRRSYSE